MIDGRKISDGIIIHCTNKDEISEMKRYLNRAKFPNIDECFRITKTFNGLDFRTGSLKHYQENLDTKYKDHLIIPFKHFLVPDKLTRFKNTLEVKLNDRQ